MAKGFDLISEWRIEVTVDEVAEILSDVARLPDWWGNVYLAVAILAEGDADGVGRVVAFHSRRRLPYTIRWQGRVVAADPPHGWTIEASGDLEGQGVWRLRQEGAVAVVRYDWRVAVAAGWMRLLLPVMRPLFAWNHRWAMARGEAGLRKELVRRRGER